MEPDPSLATQLLERASQGDAQATHELAPILYGELHKIARDWMGGQAREHTLQPTALVNEAWLRLFSSEVVKRFNGRGHFLRNAACAMRSVLIDHARAKKATKRGGEFLRQPLDEALLFFEERSIDVLELSESIDRLAEHQPNLAEVVELRFFAGLSTPQVAEALGVSTGTVDRRWRVARMWLRKDMPEDDRGSPAGGPQDGSQPKG